MIRTYLKRGENLQIPAEQAVQGLLKLLRFDPAVYAVFEIWDRETKNLVRHCQAVAMQGSKLLVEVPSAAHRQELMYSKQRLIDKMNQALGRRVITDIQFELKSERGGESREQIKTRFGY